MATSASGAPPGVFEELQQLFSWNPPVLRPRKSLRSTYSRPPSFYDKHFSKNLVLKTVERLPSLLQDLARNVDKSLNAALKTLPTLPGLVTADQRNDHIRGLSVRMQNEYAISSFYQQTTASYCLGVASTLGLHPTAKFSRWHPLLSWTTSTHAITDAQLSFLEEGDGEAKTRRDAILQTMDSNTRAMVEDMRKSASPLANWEFKNLIAGPVGVFRAVLNLGRFSWTYCDPSTCLKHEDGMELVNKLKVGPDAQAPPWSLPSSLENRDEEVIQAASGSGPSRLSPPPLPPRSSSSSLTPLSDEETWSSTKDKGKKRMRDDEDEDGSPAKRKGKKRKRDEDNDDEDNGNDGDKNFQDQFDVSAQSIVQQAWAQAVRVDGSVIVLNSGNHELVCIRHRASQTLYVSDLIEPHKCTNPGYGKLQVGIYIAAIQDTMDRRQQQQSQPTSSGDHDPNDDDEDNRGSGGGHGGGGGPGGGPGRGRGRGGGSGGGRGGGGRRRRGGGGGGRRGRREGSGGSQGSEGKGLIDELVAIENNIIHVASDCDLIHLYLRYDVYDSPFPASFFRSAPSIMAPTRCSTPSPPRTNHTYRQEECLTIVLTSEIGRGATGVVHRGTLEPEVCDGAMPLDVVVKLAFDTEQRDALKNEYEVYRRLRSRGLQQGIATTLGLFDDSEGAACALVMLYAGVALSTELQGNFSTSHYKSALLTLESIHRAGILHGDIRLENMLIDDSGVTIIDFGHSQQCDNQRAKDRELAQLRSILCLAGESH